MNDEKAVEQLEEFLVIDDWSAWDEVTYWKPLPKAPESEEKDV